MATENTWSEARPAEGGAPWATRPALRDAAAGEGWQRAATGGVCGGDWSAVTERPTWFALMEGVMGDLERSGREGTRRAYAAALRSLRRFRGGLDFPADDLTEDMAGEYEAYLARRGVCRNTSSMYMRVLRAVYNRAAEWGGAPAAAPFRRVYTGVDKTVRRALPLECVRRLKALDLPAGSPQGRARDLFLFSFCTRGMAFVDMAFLRKSDLRSGALTYTRRKTGRLVSVGWEPCMQELADRLGPARGRFLLPLIRREGACERRQYESALRAANRALKDVARLAGLPGPLSMHVARHSWASAAEAKSVPLHVISEAMGHESESTTRIYLASLSRETIDRANRDILDDL